MAGTKKTTGNTKSDAARSFSFYRVICWGNGLTLKHKLLLLQLGNGKSEKPNSCKWGDETWNREPNIWSNYKHSDYSKDEKNPPHWDDKVYFTGMKTRFMDDDSNGGWGTKQ